MRMQKIREEAAEKERDKYFNITWSVIPIKQEWKVKENLTPCTHNLQRRHGLAGRR
jgi:hypothetical protein